MPPCRPGSSATRYGREVSASHSSSRYEQTIFSALRDKGPLSYHELYLAVSRACGGVSVSEVDRSLRALRERGEVVRAGLRPPGEHLFKLAA